MRLGEPDGQVEGGERLVGVLAREGRAQPRGLVLCQRHVHPADDLTEVGREVLGPAGLDAERPPRLGDRPGPSVLGARAGRTGRRRPGPSARCGRHATRRRPTTPATPRTPRPRAGAAGRGRVWPDQRLGHPLHDDLPADHPRLVGLVDPHRPLVVGVEGDRRLLRRADPEPVLAWRRRRRTASRRGRQRHRRPPSRGATRRRAARTARRAGRRRPGPRESRGPRRESAGQPPARRSRAVCSMISAPRRSPSRARMSAPMPSIRARSSVSSSSRSTAPRRSSSVNAYVGEADAVAELVDALGVVVLVPEQRQHDHRLAEVHRLGGGVVATVGDHQVDLRDHLGLRDGRGAGHVVGQPQLVGPGTHAHDDAVPRPCRARRSAAASARCRRRRASPARGRPARSPPAGRPARRAARSPRRSHGRSSRSGARCRRAVGRRCSRARGGRRRGCSRARCA